MQFLQSQNKTNKNKLRTSLLVIAALLFSGCSGGSSVGTPPPTTATLTHIAITPASATVAKGQIAHFTATATYSDNTTANITGQATWASSNSGIATIGSHSGTATGIAAGNTLISASANGISSPTASLSVTTAVLTGISITPTAPSVPKGTPVTFTATATYSDNSSGNVSGSVAWASTAPTVATLNASGIAATLAQGGTSVSASANGITSNNAALTVTAPVLVSLAITPASTNLGLGNTQRFIASGTLTDGTATTPGTVAWASDHPAVATIDSTGLATTLSIGTANITASSGSITSNAALVTVVNSAPFGVMAVSAPGQVTLSWSPVTGATTYNLYWATTAGVTTVANRIVGIGSPYIHNRLTDGNTYYYRVGAVHATGETLSDEIFSFLYTGGNPAGRFSATGSMAMGIFGRSATLLPNGNVLVTGGYVPPNGFASSTPQAGAEIYDPANGGSFGATGNLLTARGQHTATLLPNGKVLIVGGNGSMPYLASAELYDPANGGSFSASAASLVTPRLGHSATLLPNGKVLITGGFSGGNHVASAELYDPATDRFTTTGSLATARYNHTATLLPSGKVLITGGLGDPAIGPYLASAEIYEPATGTSTGSFSATGGMAAARYDHTATLLPNGKVLITGGYGFGSGPVAPYLASAEIYDPATGPGTGGFSATGTMATAKRSHTATLLPNGKVLIAGGFGPGTAPYLASAEIYDPASGPTAGRFSATGNMAIPRSTHTATLLPNGKVVVIGSDVGAGSLTSAELFQ